MNELFLVNGKIHTQEANAPEASAVAIHGNRIRAVGHDNEIRALAGPAAQVIDLDPTAAAIVYRAATSSPSFHDDYA